MNHSDARMMQAAVDWLYEFVLPGAASSHEAWVAANAQNEAGFPYGEQHVRLSVDELRDAIIEAITWTARDDAATWVAERQNDSGT